MRDLTPLAAQLRSWRGAQLFYSERMTLRAKHADAERTFTLDREHVNGDLLQMTDRAANLVALHTAAITRAQLEEHSITVTETFGRGLSRTTSMQRLALNDATRTKASHAAHVCFTDSGTIRSLGATEVAWFIDNYARGRSSLEARRHERLRNAIERSEHDPAPSSASALVEALLRWRGRPVVFWVGPSLREQLSFWWACNVMRKTRQKVNAWFAGDVQCNHLYGLSVHPARDLARLFSGAHHLSTEAIDLFASKWTDFCRGRIPQNTRLARWPKEKRWAMELPTTFHLPFPRKVRSSIQLSPLDRELLTPFSGAEWRTPFDVIRQASDAWSVAMPFLGEGVPVRLAEWAAFENGRHLESRATSGARAWNRTEYRLTSAGRHALEKGVSTVAQLPPYLFGGF